MEELMAALNFDWISWLLGFFILYELFKYLHGVFEWVVKTFGFETKKMREQRERDERLAKTEKDIEEIKKNSDRNVQMFLEHEQAVVGKFTGIKNEIVEELGKLHSKLDEQQEYVDAMNQENIDTDKVMLRDRILGGMRYFSQYADENGTVRISFADHENLEAMFKKYFMKNGNGSVEAKYHNEFRKFVIDN